jgi:pyridoxine 4-dehydrogenase
VSWEKTQSIRVLSSIKITRHFVPQNVSNSIFKTRTAMSATKLTGKTIRTTGFGLMRLALPNGLSTDEAVTVMKAAFDEGCNFWNGAEFYGTPEHNSLHILKSYFTKYPEHADKVVLSIKGAYQQGKPDASPESIRRSVDNCNAILAGTKSIDIYECARVDKNVPIETSVGTLKELVAEGKIGAIGLSEVGAEKLERAIKVAPIAAVEVEASVMCTDIFHNGVSDLCAKHNIPIVAYGVFSHGLMLMKSADDAASLDAMKKALFPRFHGEALETNMKLVDELRRLADAKGCTMSQLCISWIKHMSGRGGNGEIIALPGSSSVARVRENSVEVELSEQDMQSIDGILSNNEVVGDRYAKQFADTWDM